MGGEGIGGVVMGDFGELTTATSAQKVVMGTGWQKIETAPKNQRIIGVWKDGKWQAAELWWDDMVEEWTHTSADYYCNPTHWMPLPPPPSEGEMK